MPERLRELLVGLELLLAQLASEQPDGTTLGAVAVGFIGSVWSVGSAIGPQRTTATLSLVQRDPTPRFSQSE